MPKGQPVRRIGSKNRVPPPPLGLVESRGYAGESSKIFGFKELIGKIFRTKDLASGTILPGRYAQRVSYIARSAERDRSQVTDECDGRTLGAEAPDPRLAS